MQQKEEAKIVRQAVKIVRQAVKTVWSNCVEM
jgi:hypothetical protein